MYVKQILLVLVAAPIASSLLTHVSSGPPKGTLILDGAGCRAARERFVSLAGGPEANIVYIITGASGIKLDDGSVYTPPESSTRGEQTSRLEEELARYIGVKRIAVLHTRDRKEADSEAFAAPLRTASGVWLGVGNAGRLAAAYLDTLTLRELWAVLDRGGVIGGESAGAIIQGSFIVRGRPDKPLLMAKGHERGFGFLKNVVIDPHLIAARREDELVNVLDAHPDLLGIGIDANAGLIVRGDQFEVIGESKVAIYDDKKHGSGWYYWLAPGDRFDLRTRTAQPALMPRPR